MGGALLEGWLDRGVPPSDIAVVEPAEAGRPPAAFAVIVAAEAEALPAGFAPDVVVLAVKPQAMEQVLPAYRRFAGSAVFLSIAAGKPLGFFARHLGADSAVVRAMPNTPAAVRCGITVACPNSAVDAARRAVCQELLEAVGEVLWTEDEGLMDAVTAVSGSGPAYVFLLAEALADAGAQAGLPPEMAARLARATLAGAGELLRLSPEPAETLRRNVTSPGGTTAAALDVLMADKGLSSLMVRAVAAAARRSRELAG